MNVSHPSNTVASSQPHSSFDIWTHNVVPQVSFHRGKDSHSPVLISSQRGRRMRVNSQIDFDDDNELLEYCKDTRVQNTDVGFAEKKEKYEWNVVPSVDPATGKLCFKFSTKRGVATLVLDQDEAIQDLANFFNSNRSTYFHVHQEHETPRVIPSQEIKNEIANLVAVHSRDENHQPQEVKRPAKRFWSLIGRKTSG